MHVLCVLFSALLNSFTYTSKQLQTLDFPHQMNTNSWQNNTLTAFKNSQQQSFIQAWKTTEKLKKTHLESMKNEVLQKFSAKRMLGEDEGKQEEKNREEEEKWQKFFSSSLISLVYLKRKAKSKMTIDFGGKWLKCPSTSHNTPN